MLHASFRMKPFTNKSRLSSDRCSAGLSIANRKCSMSHRVTESASDLNKCSDRLLSPALSPASQSHTKVLSSRSFAFTAETPSPEMICRLNSSLSAQAQPGSLRCSETPTRSRYLKEDRCFHRRISEQLANFPGRTAMMVVSLFVLILAANVAQSESSSVGLCRGVQCANGGRLLVDNSVWGHCRCRCRPGYVGPYCQHVVAEEGSFETTTNVDQRNLSGSDALNRIRMRILELSQQWASYQASVNRTAAATSNVTDIPRGSPDGGEIRSLLTNEETAEDSPLYDSIRRSWFSAYFRR